MAKVLYFAMFFYSVSVLVAGKLGHPPGPQKLQHNVTDSFKVWEAFKELAAITDINNDTIFDCVHSYQTAIDPEARTATYVQDFGSDGLVEFHAKAGNTPPEYTVTVGEDPESFEGLYYYNDYETCLISELNYKVYECMLWVDRKLNDDVPQECIDQFVDTCGVIVPKYSRDLCPDGEGDYK